MLQHSLISVKKMQIEFNHMSCEPKTIHASDDVKIPQRASFDTLAHSHLHSHLHAIDHMQIYSNSVLFVAHKLIRGINDDIRIMQKNMKTSHTEARVKPIFNNRSDGNAYFCMAAVLNES